MTGEGGDRGAACLDACDVSDDFRLGILVIRLVDCVHGKVLGLAPGSGWSLGLTVASNHWGSVPLSSFANLLHVPKLVAIAALDGLRSALVRAGLPERGLSVFGPYCIDGLDFFIVQLFMFSSISGGGLVGDCGDRNGGGFDLFVLLDGLDFHGLLVDVIGGRFSGRQYLGTDFLVMASNKHLCLDVFAVVVHAFLLAGNFAMMVVIVVFVTLHSKIRHVVWSDLLQLFEDGRHPAVEIPNGFLGFLLEILEVGTDDLRCSFLVIRSQELGLDDVELGEVLLIAEVLESVPPGEGVIPHELSELNDLPLIGVPFDPSSLWQTCPCQGCHGTQASLWISGCGHVQLE